MNKGRQYLIALLEEIVVRADRLNETAVMAHQIAINAAGKIFAQAIIEYINGNSWPLEELAGHKRQ